MGEMAMPHTLQDALEVVERLPDDDQVRVIEIIRGRLRERGRARLADEVASSRAAYDRGEVRRGTAAELMAEVEA